MFRVSFSGILVEISHGAIKTQPYRGPFTGWNLEIIMTQQYLTKNLQPMENEDVLFLDFSTEMYWILGPAIFRPGRKFQTTAPFRTPN